MYVLYKYKCSVQICRHIHIYIYNIYIYTYIICIYRKISKHVGIPKHRYIETCRDMSIPMSLNTTKTVCFSLGIECDTAVVDFEHICMHRLDADIFMQILDAAFMHMLDAVTFMHVLDAP